MKVRRFCIGADTNIELKECDHLRKEIKVVTTVERFQFCK